MISLGFLVRFRAEAAEPVHRTQSSRPGEAAVTPCGCWQQSHPLPRTADKGRAGKSQQGLQGKPGVTPWQGKRLSGCGRRMRAGGRGRRAHFELPGAAGGEGLAMGLLSPCQHCCTHQRRAQHPSSPHCTSAAPSSQPSPRHKLEGKSISCFKKKKNKQGSKVSVKYRSRICK